MIRERNPLSTALAKNADVIGALMTAASADVIARTERLPVAAPVERHDIPSCRTFVAERFLTVSETAMRGIGQQVAYEPQLAFRFGEETEDGLKLTIGFKPFQLRTGLQDTNWQSPGNSSQLEPRNFDLSEGLSLGIGHFTSRDVVLSNGELATSQEKERPHVLLASKLITMASAAIRRAGTRQVANAMARQRTD